jgi:hypothetical protein
MQAGHRGCRFGRFGLPLAPLIERHQLIMKDTRILIVVTALLLCGCLRRGAPPLAETLQSKNSVASFTSEAGKFLKGLHEQGRLPGLSKDEHGELKAKVSDFSGTAQFPLSRTFQFTKNSDSVCNYAVERLSLSSDWRLVKAWQTDATGKTVKEFPPQ